MKKHIKALFCLMLALAIAFFLMGCSGNSTDKADGADESEITMEDVNAREESEDKNYDNGISFDEEEDGADVVTQKKTIDDFVGSWEATSGQALYQYGNVDISIKLGGKWTGNISDEDLEGKWKEQDDGIYLTSDLFECYLAFSDSGALIMQYDPEDDSGELITTVLSKK